jgi:hypothetical protein
LSVSGLTCAKVVQGTQTASRQAIRVIAIVLLLYPFQRRPLPFNLEKSSKGRLYQKKFYVPVRSLSIYYFACRKKFLNPKALIACQDVSPPKGFDKKNRPKPGIRLVDRHLECCLEARFWKIASTGRSPWSCRKNLSSTRIYCFHLQVNTGIPGE